MKQSDIIKLVEDDEGKVVIQRQKELDHRGRTMVQLLCQSISSPDSPLHRGDFHSNKGLVNCLFEVVEQVDHGCRERGWFADAPKKEQE